MSALLIFFLLTSSLLAGFVDSVVGGGGLILVPALFSALPQELPATLLGTNKGAGVWGTAWAARQYARRVRLSWGALFPAAMTAMVASALGASLAEHVSPTGVRRGIPLLLAALLLYTLLKKNLGRAHAPRFSGRREACVASSIGLCIGAYDGFFGPGTGSFLVFSFVRILGYDFLHASASAKIVNAATNLAALALFVAHGHLRWPLACSLAVCNVAGSFLGARAAMRRGAGFVRVFFLAVVFVLMIKTARDAAFW